MIQAIAVVGYDAIYTVLLHCVLQPLALGAYCAQDAGDL